MNGQGKQQADEVAGIELDNLKQFNYYTIIGDGELNVPYLKIRVKTQRMFTELKKLEFVTGRFTKSAEHTLNFSDLPIVTGKQIGRAHV